jgi:hypothetical protein
LQENEKKQVVSLLDELSKAVEELLFAGLTAASKSTVERLDVTFKEASRMKLLRLGSTLRIANEEIIRFTGGSPLFSARRLAFFLGRAWLLATAMRRAIDAGDQETLNRLLVASAAQPIEKLKFVVLGVAKRVVPGAFASFDFRLRALGGVSRLVDKEPLIWSCVFPLRKDLDLPSEAFLHLPQKQKFKPSMLLEKRIVEVTQCAVSTQLGTATRLALNDDSTMTAGESFTDWSSVCGWDIVQAAERLERHKPTPIDLEIELQEEVFISNWSPGEQRGTKEGYDILPIQTSVLPFEVRFDQGPSGVPLNGVLSKIAKKKRRPPLYGVVHYESCQLILQPLSVLAKAGIEYLTISPDKISQAELVKAMKFT